MDHPGATTVLSGATAGAVRRRCGWSKTAEAGDVLLAGLGGGDAGGQVLVLAGRAGGFGSQARQVAAALGVAADVGCSRHAYQQRQDHQIERQAGLAGAAVQLNESLDLAVVVERICREASVILDAERAWISWVKETGNVAAAEVEVEPGPVAPCNPDASPAGRLGAAGTVAREQRGGDLRDWVAPGNARGSDRNWVAVPLRWDCAVRAILCVVPSAGTNQAGRRHLDEFALLAAAALRNAVELADATRRADIDGLTGCLNRMALHTSLSVELQRCSQRRTPLSLLMLDVDRFQAVNATWGHLVGDRVLSEVGQKLRDSVRPYDLVSRYGSDQFAVVAPEADQRGARELAIRLQDALRGPGALGPVSVSVGISNLQPSQTVDQLIDAAEAALLYAKRGHQAGRIHLTEGPWWAKAAADDRRTDPGAAKAEVTPLVRPPATVKLAQPLIAAGLTPALGLTLLFVLDRRLAHQLSRGPALLALSAAGALLAAYLLRTFVVAFGRRELRWLPWALGMAAAVAVVRGLLPGLEAGMGTNSAPDTAARISLLQLTVLPTFAALAHRDRRFANGALLTGWAAVTTWWVATDDLAAPGPLQIVTPTETISPLGHGLLVGILAWSAVVAIDWFRRSNWRPVAPEAWVGVLLAINAVSVVPFLLARRAQDDWWWASVELGAARFVLPALGLLAGLVSLYLVMDRYGRALEHHILGLMNNVPASNLRRRREPPNLATQQRVSALLDPDGLTMFFQPVIELATGRQIGMEALARASADTDRPADQLFEEAARCGRADDLEFAAVASALAQVPLLPPQCWVAVNLSPRLIHDPRFADLFGHAPLDRVVLEVTEREAIADYEALGTAIQPLRSAGLRLAIDDTGAGHAGLRHLIGLRPDIIKLDISVIADLEAGSARESLAAALVSFARTVGSRLIAEGIESARTTAILVDLGIPYGQGFALARPAPLSRSGDV